jgi:hypothetical protein
MRWLLLRCMSLEVAPLRHAGTYDECRLSGVKLKYRGHRQTVPFDPSRKWLFSPSSPSGQLITALRNVFRSGSFAPDRNLNAVEIGWPFRLGLEGCIVDRSQDIGWQSIRKDIAPFAVTWTYIPSRSVTL